MAWLLPWLLFIHVIAAIVAFGPTFAFALIGSMGAREPRHANFATRLSDRLENVLVLPFAIVVLVSGALMIWVAGIALFEPAARWLLVSIVLYLVALALSVFVSRPAVRRIIELSREDAVSPAPELPGRAGGALAVDAPGAARAAGPPPELLRSAATVRRVGMVLTGLTVLVAFLMVMKPDFGF